MAQPWGLIIILLMRKCQRPAFCKGLRPKLRFALYLFAIYPVPYCGYREKTLQSI